MTQWWSWLLTGVGIAGLWLAAKRPRVGFMVNVSGQVLWASYAVATRQWGFLLSAGLYAVVFLRLWLAAKPEQEVSED